MKIAAAVFADFTKTFFDGPSQLSTRLGSRSVLGHTLQRLTRVDGLDQRCLFVRPADELTARAALDDAGLSERFDLLALDDGARPRRGLIRSARRWNPWSWRGSPLSTTWFDEFVEPRCVAQVLDHYACEAVLCLDGHQPALDPRIAADMIARLREYDAETKLVATQAPPGLAGVILRREITRDLLQQNLTVGILLSYRPEMPQPDPITRAPVLQVPAEIAQTAVRLTADTRRSRELLAAAFAELGEDCAARELCEWMRRAEEAAVAPLPIEIEIELTTDDPLPATTLRPRGDRVPKRQLADLDAVSRTAEQLCRYDDRLIFLGGHGDPLHHPQFGEVCRRIRAAGSCGLGVATTLVDPPDAAIEALFEHRVDLLEVQLDAHSRETYRTVHGADRYEHVIANIERIGRQRQERASAQPIVICSLTRCARALEEQERFFDGWIQAGGWAVIDGYNNYCGLLPADALRAATPPVREACRRLDRRLMLHADGQVPLCGQDVAGATTLGNWQAEPLAKIWTGPGLRSLRSAHAGLDLEQYPLCARCGEWFRP